MDRRRGPSKRPASSEELEYWIHAKGPLQELSKIYNSPSASATIDRVNRLISVWSDSTLPAEGFDGLKNNYQKLTTGLQEIKHAADRETSLLSDAVERISVLIAMRRASADIAPQEKRNKRPRAHSPSRSIGSKASSPAPSANGRSGSMSITVPPRPPVPFSKDPKQRRAALSKQLPLHEGRKVAFHYSKEYQSDNNEQPGWIMAVITQCINQDKNRYEVQDVERGENGEEGRKFNTTLRAIIPLPDPSAPPDDSAHVNAYHEYSVSATVMALYPDTSCFYPAVVTASPKDMAQQGMKGENGCPLYKLKFEDDDDQEHIVSALFVVECPGHDRRP